MSTESKNFELELVEEEGFPEQETPGERELVLEDGELLDQRAGAMRRTGRRLARMLKELKGIELELDRLDLTLQLPGLSARLRRDIQAELDLSVDAYNHLREAASFAFRQLIKQRESFGFRGHDLVRRCYPIPDLLLPPDFAPDLLEA